MWLVVMSGLGVVGGVAGDMVASEAVAAAAATGDSVAPVPVLAVGAAVAMGGAIAGNTVGVVTLVAAADTVGGVVGGAAITSMYQGHPPVKQGDCTYIAFERRKRKGLHLHCT